MKSCALGEKLRGEALKTFGFEAPSMRRRVRDGIACEIDAPKARADDLSAFPCALDGRKLPIDKRAPFALEMYVRVRARAVQRRLLTISAKLAVERSPALMPRASSEIDLVEEIIKGDR